MLATDALIYVKRIEVLRIMYRYSTDFQPTVLSSLKYLRTLEMYSSFQPLTRLTKEFKDLVHLRSLIIKPILMNGKVRVGRFHMTDMTFENVPHLKELQISQVLLSISPTALNHFTQLSTLSLLCNHRLNNADVFKAIKNMPGPTLRTLTLDGSQHHGFFYLSKDLTDTPNVSNITHLSLRYTNLIEVDAKALLHFINLRHLVIGHNSFLVKHRDYSPNEILELLNTLKIETIDVTGLGHPRSNINEKFAEN